jgi:hypothetical protein
MSVFSLGQRVIFVFGYCLGIPNYDEGVITRVDADWITVECENTDGRSRIPLKARTMNYGITLHVSRFLNPDDEQRVIDAWYHFSINRSNTPLEKRVESSELLMRIARQYQPSSETKRDYRLHL